MKKVAIIVGHDVQEQGAVGVENISEYVFNSVLAREIVDKIGDDDNVKIFKRSHGLSYTQAVRKVHGEVDNWGAFLDIELHFNSAENKEAKGHLIVYATTRAKKYAEELSKSFSIFLNTRNRGIEHRTKGNGVGGLRAGKSISLIAEPFFGVEQSSFREGRMERENLVSAYAKFIADVVDSKIK